MAIIYFTRKVIKKSLTCDFFKLEVSVVNLGTISLLLKDILFVETEKRNVRIHTKAQDYISRENISCMEARLEPYGFYRCHKSYIISLDAVKFFDRVNVHMVDGSCAMVSVRKYAELKRRYLERRLECIVAGVKGEVTAIYVRDDKILKTKG